MDTPACTPTALTTCTTYGGSPFTVGTEGTHILTYFSVDNAGNVEAANTATFQVDTTPPTTTAAVAGTQGSNGWYKAGSPVQLTLTATDNLSGVASTTYAVNGGPSQTYTVPVPFTDGVYTVTYGSTDQASNVETTRTISFKVDQTPPALTGSQSPAPNAAGWNNTNVSVSFACTDATSGVASIQASGAASGSSSSSPLAVTVTSEGANQTVSATCTDNAGNTALANVGDINIDKTPPEAYLQFDPTKQDWLLFGRDALSGVLTGPIAPVSVTRTGSGVGARNSQGQHDDEGSVELRTYRVTDAAGNTLVLVARVKKDGQELTGQIVSLQYNGGPVMAPARNDAAFEWSVEKSGGLKNLEQTIHIGSGKTGQTVDARFDAKKNQTIIKIDPSDQTISKPGLVLLRLATHDGQLTVEF